MADFGLVAKILKSADHLPNLTTKVIELLLSFMNGMKADSIIRPWLELIGFMSSVRTPSIELFEIGSTRWCSLAGYDDLLIILLSLYTYVCTIICEQCCGPNPCSENNQLLVEKETNSTIGGMHRSPRQNDLYLSPLSSSHTRENIVLSTLTMYYSCYKVRDYLKLEKKGQLNCNTSNTCESWYNT